MSYMFVQVCYLSGPEMLPQVLSPYLTKCPYICNTRQIPSLVSLNHPCLSVSICPQASLFCPQQTARIHWECLSLLSQLIQSELKTAGNYN